MFLPHFVSYISPTQQLLLHARAITNRLLYTSTTMSDAGDRAVGSADQDSRAEVCLRGGRAYPPPDYEELDDTDSDETIEQQGLPELQDRRQTFQLQLETFLVDFASAMRVVGEVTSDGDEPRRNSKLIKSGYCEQAPGETAGAIVHLVIPS